METRGILVSLLVLGQVWTLQGVPVVSEPLYPTQENFSLDKFMGKWHDVAMASNCPNARTVHITIGSWELDMGSTEGQVNMKRTARKQGTCLQVSGQYVLTTTPGRFLYNVESWTTPLDAYVVHTNYQEYAIVIMDRQKSAQERCIAVKLFSRTMEVRPTVLDDFKTLAREQGMSDDDIVIQENKGECIPGEQMEEPVTQPEPQRVRRSVVPSALPAQEEGSGDDSPLFGPESCKAEPDVGPCFGMVERFFYNSSSMSCQLFNYGGCLGNQNNFDTEKQCLQSCRTEAVCRLPMVAFPCTGQQLPVWTFDPVSGQCLAYKQGYCQANGNKFYSQAECQEYCGVAKEDGEFLKAI